MNRNFHLPIYCYFLASLLFISSLTNAADLPCKNTSTGGTWPDSTVHVYNLHLSRELILFSPSVALGVAELFLDARPFTVDDLASLSVENVPWFERNIIYFDSATATRAANASDLLNKTSMVIGFASILAGYKNPQAVITNGVLFLEASFLTAGVTDVLKKTVGRVRPYAYNTNYPDDYRVRGAVTSSFPSGHTSSSAFSCFFAAKMIDDYLIDDENHLLKTVDWAAATAIPLLTGYFRMEAGVHFFTDVLAGFTIGASCGYFIPELHKIKGENLTFYPVFNPAGNGIGMQLQF